jgi:L,D-transpeptidase ErfK/SrfK
MRIFSRCFAHTIVIINVVTLTIFSAPSFGKTYTLPAGGDTLIGGVEYVTSAPGETLLSIAQHFDLGLNSIDTANPGVGPLSLLPGGMHVTVPTAHILPPLPHAGIVVNLPEMRLYYYPATGNGVVMTYPIGIGRVGKTIPIKRTAVVRKVVNPTWTPTASERAFNEEQGIVLPKIMPAGPDNPLGPYAIYLGIPAYLIHSTIFPDSIGRRASFGCIRMHEDDIKDFFPLVKSGIPVIIIDMPNKVGWAGNELLLETHQPLEERTQETYAGVGGIISSIETATSGKPTFVDWQMVSYLAEMRDGMPHEIGFRLH